jgi:hypothetical protein
VFRSLSLEGYYSEIKAQLESILLTLGPELSPEESRVARSCPSATTAFRVL